MFFFLSRLDPFAGGEIEVNDLKLKAEEICAIPNTDQPFMCLDVSYIAMLLEEGFGLLPTTKVKVYHLHSNGNVSNLFNNFIFIDTLVVQED